MNPTTVGLLMFAAMLLLMVVRVPISVAMFVPGMVGYALLAGEGTLLNQLKNSALARLSSYDLSVIPLFLLMGNFATQGGLSRALFEAASAFLGHVRGGLAMSSIASSAVFGAVCGSSVATAATITQVAYPQMKQLGYSGRLSTATLALGGTLGILIPPSVPLVIYAILTEQNLAKLFAAATIPGILAAIGYLMVIAIVTRRNPALAPLKAALPWPARFQALLGVWPILLIFLLVFGGIYGGIFTPTEGASVGALGTFIVGLLKGELKWPGVRRALLSTAEATAMVFMIFLGADMLTSALALTQLPARISEWIAHLPVAPILIVAGILLLYIVLGAVMDELSMIVLTIPVLFPAVMAMNLYGLDSQEKAIWFGILVLMTVEFGLVAPPVGLCVYVVNSLTKDVPMSETYLGVLPFLVSDLIRIVLLLLFPVISLFLVRAFFS
jgi:tripartite ATP-independent transporter DctM subunit